jgi:hypothetical protein
MVYPISQTAIDYVRRTATSIMISTCRIERVNKPSFNTDTGRAVPGSKTTIYEGPCRIWEVSGGAPILVSEDEVTMQSTQLSIPWNASPVPERNDEVEILTSPDPAVVGKRFVIDTSAKAGEMRATRRFAVRGYQKS